MGRETGRQDGLWIDEGVVPRVCGLELNAAGARRAEAGVGIEDIREEKDTCRKRVTARVYPCNPDSNSKA